MHPMTTKFSQDAISLSDLKVNPGKAVNQAIDSRYHLEREGDRDRIKWQQIPRRCALSGQHQCSGRTKTAGSLYPAYGVI
jgi:hypothetical protein